MSDTTKKTYKKGFYGGKFLPFHKGHAHCIVEAAGICEELFVLLFINTDEEKAIFKAGAFRCPKAVLTPDYRVNAMTRFCLTMKNVRLVVLDCNCIYSSDSPLSTWEQEIPFVLDAVGNDFDAVFSSEPSYDDFLITHFYKILL